MAHIRQHHHERLWMELWNVFALTATGIGMVLLLLFLAAVALFG